MSSEKVCAIVVTYNRKELLRECIFALLHQTHPLSVILVVDNASTDGTPALLAELQKQSDKIQLLLLNENTGGAGGFHRGIKHALNRTDCNWFWLMDDDVEPLPDAVRGLLGFSDQAKCLHGRRLNPDGSTYFWQAWFNSSLGFSVPKADPAFAKGASSVEVNVGCFEGMFIHREIVEKIGPPDFRFFITWDDTIYGYLASKHTRSLYVNHPVLKRKRQLRSVNLGVRTLNESSDLYRYYHIKNRFLVRTYLRNLNEFKPLAFHFMTSIFFLKELIRAIILQRNFKAYQPLCRGLRDGIKEYP